MRDKTFMCTNHRLDDRLARIELSGDHPCLQVEERMRRRSYQGALSGQPIRFRLTPLPAPLLFQDDDLETCSEH